MFRRNRQSAKATILAREQLRDAEGYLVYKYAADVRPDDGAPGFRAEIKPPFNQLDWNGPLPGAVVEVTFDPKSHHVKFDMSDPSLRLSTAKAAERERFDAALSGRPGTTPVDPPVAQHSDQGAALQDVSATSARISSGFDDAAATIAAIKEARAAGDLAEVDRLKAEYQRRSQTKTAGAADPLDSLRKLADLHDRGALTDEEFAAEKAKLLRDD